jgi:hypothetical protein
VNVGRLRYVLPLQCRGLLGRAWWAVVGLMTGAAVLCAAGVGWDGEYPTLFGAREAGGGPSSDRADRLAMQIAAYMSTAWLAGLFAYALPAVCLPLAASFGPTQVCWLRGLACTPREVAVGRAARLLAAVALTSLHAVIGVVVQVIRHDLYPQRLLTVALGWAAHLLLSGGLVLAAGPWLSGAGHRLSVTVLAVFLPVACWLATFLCAGRLGEAAWVGWVPYACPYTENLGQAARHYAAAAAVGLALAGWSVAGAGGRVVGGGGSESH